MAKRLGRSCVGYEIDLELRDVIEERLGLKQKTLLEPIKVEVVVRDDAKKLRSKIRDEVEKRLSNKGNRKK